MYERRRDINALIIRHVDSLTFDIYVHTKIDANSK